MPLLIRCRRVLRLSKWIRWEVISIAALLAITTTLVALHGQIERGVIAYRLYRAGSFIPPTLASGESQWVRCWRNARFYWDFSELRGARERRLKELNPELRSALTFSHFLRSKRFRSDACARITANPCLTSFGATSAGEPTGIELTSHIVGLYASK